jgi:hypothetical protein
MMMPNDMNLGIYPQIPLGLAWNSGNIGGSLKRGTGIAMQVMGGNCGGIIASYVYLSRDGPRFITGHSILIGFVRYVKATFLFFTMTLTNRYQHGVRIDTFYVDLVSNGEQEKRCGRSGARTKRING